MKRSALGWLLGGFLALAGWILIVTSLVEIYEMIKRCT